MVRAYRLLNVLSFDVALGAVISAIFFARLLHAPVHSYGLAALGLSVWIIYTVDRLRDVRFLTQPALSERHRFHQTHGKPLRVAIVVAVLAIGALLIFMRASVIAGGLILAPISIVYLLLQNKLPIKELMVAILYTLGVLLPAWSENWAGMVSAAAWISQFFLIALVNLLLFAWFECDADGKMGHASLATRLGKKTEGILLVILLVMGSGFSLVNAILNPISWIFVFMWLVLAAIFIFHPYAEQHERYRLWGDAIFYIPVFGLL